jgi:hypothetical protein
VKLSAPDRYVMRTLVICVGFILHMENPLHIGKVVNLWRADSDVKPATSI